MSHHFLAYAPAEANSERGLAVDHDFNALAKANAIEILADDEAGLYKQEKRKKWLVLILPKFTVFSI